MPVGRQMQTLGRQLLVLSHEPPQGGRTSTTRVHLLLCLSSKRSGHGRRQEHVERRGEMSVEQQGWTVHRRRRGRWTAWAGDLLFAGPSGLHSLAGRPPPPPPAQSPAGDGRGWPFVQFACPRGIFTPQLSPATASIHSAQFNRTHAPLRWGLNSIKRVVLSIRPAAHGLATFDKSLKAAPLSESLGCVSVVLDVGGTPSAVLRSCLVPENFSRHMDMCALWTPVVLSAPLR